MNGDDEPVTGAVTAYAADRLVDAAVRRGYVLQPATTGVIVIRRPRIRIVVELHPACRPALSSWQAQGLALFADRQACVRVRPEGVILTVGLARIPPAATRRLLHRGWLSCRYIREGEPVSVSVAGRLALALNRHRTRTSRARGWHFAADYPNGPQVIGRDRHGGRIYDGSSTPLCSCGWSRPAEWRPEDAHAARQHRVDTMIAALSPETRYPRPRRSAAGSPNPRPARAPVLAGGDRPR